jgi:hypothetical protein
MKTILNLLKRAYRFYKVKRFQLLLVKLNACEEAKDWVADKSWEEVYSTCHRGDWLLWLFAKTNPKDLQLLTLAKGHCANTVRHIMTDERSLKAVDAAIAFGEGKITIEELDAAAWGADAACSAANAADANAADADAAAYDAARAANWAAHTACAAAWSANADAEDVEGALAAYESNQKLTADICRKYLPIEIWNVK